MQSQPSEDEYIPMEVFEPEFNRIKAETIQKLERTEKLLEEFDSIREMFNRGGLTEFEGVKKGLERHEEALNSLKAYLTETIESFAPYEARIQAWKEANGESVDSATPNGDENKVTL